jgi:hypothetical protein
MFWEKFWFFVIWFSIVTFTYLSVVALIKGVDEMKRMFKSME